MFRPAWAGQVCSLGWALAEQVEDDLGLELTAEQIERLVLYYELDPKTGGRIVRRAAYRGPKGIGKSPEGGYLAWLELVGPVVFDRWDREGQPVGKLRTDPWVQIAAVSEDQTANVMNWLYDTLDERPSTRATYRVDLGRTRILLTDRPGRIEIVTSAATTREGARSTFVVLDQTESWDRSNGGIRLHRTLLRNVGKRDGWSLELQNAPEPGDGTVADKTAKAAASKRADGILYWCRKAPEVASPDQTAALRKALRHVYGSAALHTDPAGRPRGWVNIDRLVGEIQDPDADWSESRRYYLNLETARSDRAFDRERWPALAELARTVKPGTQIVVGFDGSRFDDATAIVAVEIDTGFAWLAGLWERPTESSESSTDWEVPEPEVTAAMVDLFTRYDVWRLYADPPYWQATVAAWRSTWGETRVVEWWTSRTRQAGYACRNLATAIRAGELHHDGDPELTRHVTNAVRRSTMARNEDGARLWTIAKPEPSLKIDAAMALVLAWEARTDALAAGAARTQKKASRKMRTR